VRLIYKVQRVILSRVQEIDKQIKSSHEIFRIFLQQNQKIPTLELSQSYAMLKSPSQQGERIMLILTRRVVETSNDR